MYARLKYFSDRTPANEWPSKGEIMFKNYSLRYSSDSPNVLENINVYIESMEKVLQNIIEISNL